MKSSVRFSVLMICAIFLGAMAGCSTEPAPEKKIENVVRVFFHRSFEYTLYVQPPGESKIAEIAVCAGYLFTDVPAG